MVTPINQDVRPFAVGFAPSPHCLFKFEFGPRSVATTVVALVFGMQSGAEAGPEDADDDVEFGWRRNIFLKIPRGQHRLMLPEGRDTPGVSRYFPLDTVPPFRPL